MLGRGALHCEESYLIRVELDQILLYSVFTEDFTAVIILSLGIVHGTTAELVHLSNNDFSFDDMTNLTTILELFGMDELISSEFKDSSF